MINEIQGFPYFWFCIYNTWVCVFFYYITLLSQCFPTIPISDALLDPISTMSLKIILFINILEYLGLKFYTGPFSILRVSGIFYNHMGIDARIVECKQQQCRPACAYRHSNSSLIICSLESMISKLTICKISMF